jgi:elongation factor 2
MPRFRQLADIQQVMSQKEQIRNLGIIAHIDHGKTTLADALLAGAGLLSTQMAGEARVLDYLEEEQKRKITIKAANITLLYKYDGKPYIVNLVDTPGHVDFTGKVTRALRAIDGVVVVVDAVEEIMAQTEIVTRQALQERVRPVLFINKIDRLITELQLSEPQIQAKLDHIISGFNDLIELYAEEPFKKAWKVDPTKGNVAFGSALHGWGFTLEQAKKASIRFSDIIRAYADKTQADLRRKLAVHEAILAMAFAHLPNPRQAQAYRVDRIWAGTKTSPAGQAIAACRDDAFAVMCVTNVQAPEEGASVVTGRVFSGKIKAGDTLYRVNAQMDVTVDKVYVSMGSFREEVSEVSSGNIAVLAVQKMMTAGETLVDGEHKAGMVPFEGINYVSEPVMIAAVEPKNPKDILILLKALQKLVTEDPNLTFAVDKETGEYLLNVMGELHLEVALNQLKSVSGGLELTVSPPRVVYRESVTKKGTNAMARSPNKKNQFTIQVDAQDNTQTGQLTVEEAGIILSVDEQRNVLVDCSGKTEVIDGQALEAVIGGFEFACKAGPLCGEPMRHIEVDLIDLQLSGDVEEQGTAEIMRGVCKAIFGSFLTAKPVLLEPVYKTIITTPTELAGECSRIISTRRGKIRSFEQKGLQTVITVHIPVAETLGLSKELRTTTSGRAFWQNMLDTWEQVPEKLASKIITEIRQRKGLPPEVPAANRFLEENDT